MDDSWLAKCVASPPQMSPLLATEPGSQAVTSPHLTQAPATASAAQIHKNTRHHFHSLIRREPVLNDQTRVQETAAISNLNLGYRLGKTELGNSFLALLSDEFSHLPHSRMNTAKIHINNDKVLTGTGCVVPSINIPPLPENHGNGTLGNWNEHSSFVVSRTATSPAPTKVPFLHNNVRLVGNSHHVRDYVEVAPCQSSQANNTGTAGTPWDELCNSGRSANADKNSNKDVHASRIISFDAESPISHNNPSYLRGHRPLVFCRSTVGELFMGDAGLLGVLCFCHNSHMSVPKFCEHSGWPSANPSEAVYLENGMNISHWCKQYLGIMAPDEIIGREWSGGSATIDVLVGSKVSDAPILLNNNVAISNIQSFGGSWRPAKPLNNSIPSSPYIKVRYTMQDKSINKEHDNACLSYNFHGTRNCQKKITSSVPASMPNTMKKQPLNSPKQPPISVGLEKVPSTLFKGKEIVVQQLDTSGGTYTGKHTSCIPLACSWTNGTVRHDDGIDNPNSSAEAPLADIDGASNIELRLGQPSEKYNVFAGSSVLQIGPAYDSVKPQPHQQLKEQFGRTWTANQTRKDLHFSPSEASPYNKGSTQHTARPFNARNHFDSEGLARDANMNPLISLFLSHLEGNNTSLSLDNLFNGSEHLSSKMPHNVCNSVGDSTHGTRSVCNTSTVNFANKLDKGKNILAVESDTIKSDSMVQNEVTNTREMSVPFNSKCCQNSILENGKDFSFYLDNQSNMLQKHSVGNTKQQEKSTFLSNKECDDPVECGVLVPIPCGSLGTDLLKSDHLMSSTTLCSLETSKNIFATTKHLMDAKSKSSAFRRVVEFSTQESPNVAKTNSQHHQLCCLSSSKLESCKDELAVQTGLREGSYCKTHLDGSKVLVRHSCPSCRSAVGMDIFSGHPCHTGSTRSCNCSCSTKRALLKSEKCCKRFSSCCNCDVDEQPCLRLGRLSNNCFPGDHKHEMFNHREHTSCSSGHCCTSVFPYCFHGFYTSGSNSTSKALNEQEVCGQANITHTAGDNDSNYLLPECKRIRLTHCDCSKNNSSPRNDQQTVFWRDVPKKTFPHAGASHDKFAEALKNTNNDSHQVPNCATEFNKTHLNSHVTKAPQMSNMSSGSSAPVLTQVSVEVNDSIPCIRTSPMMHDLVVDEGSGNEKCGSSDVVIRDGNEGFNTVDKVNVAKSRFDCLASYSSINPIDELHLKIPYKSKKVKCLNEELAKQENVKYRRKLEMTPRTAANKSEEHIPLFDAFGGPDIPNNVRHLENDSSQSQDIEVSKPGCVTQRTHASLGSAAIIKRKRSVLSSNKSKERIGYQDRVPEDDNRQLQNDDCSVRLFKSAGEKMKQGLAACSKHESRSGTGKPPKFMSLNCIANISSKTSLPKKSKPVVCGNSGIISSGGTDGDQKPAKIISLASILKRARKCSLTETSDIAVKQHSELLSCNLLSEKDALTCFSEDEKNPAIFCRLEESCECLRKNGEDLNSPSTAKAFRSGNSTSVRCGLHSMQSISNLRHKDICTRSTSKLTAKSRHHAKSTCSSNTEINECSKLTVEKDQLNCSPSATCGLEDQDNKLYQQKSLDPALPTTIGSFPYPKNSQDHAGKLSQVSRSSCSLLNPDAFCCVCGSSNQGDTNQLLECHDCLIKVHQACYGVSKIPKGNWCCRPCKCNSQDTVCVLCGYGDGAMTKAVKCQNIIKSLLKAWKVSKGSYFMKTIPSEHAEIVSLNPDSADESSNFNNCCSVAETYTPERKSRMSGKYLAFNSIITGSLDTSITQWVHMVCALWTPGTRCPNVDTMNTFDVSGALPAKKNVVCSLCKRPGGSCIECRVSSCSVPFHPWCAHQKGLLQSEIEGDDDEKVGFYGRCLHHVMPNNSQLDNYVVDPQQSLRKEECSCARTEGVRSRKRERTQQHNLQGQGKDGVCIVSQEQINAWLHINGQKCRARGLTKPSGSDVENDYRKEYILYKQLKRWKHLVVYKSGIHALGLYTSQFIPRGAMVVEYIGEIVGLRVADKREVEYQSGRRIQYKSACYFFRIDKEHIIDATRKGGIARFVNHSCLPNCVAKVITVRNEKKVVFFAERDINPGEEITYDYHFNSEDEGEKIPCFCNSKNCRRYLN